MALKIICDSAADIGQSEMNGVFVAPMSVSFGNVTYQDGVDLTHDRFYECWSSRTAFLRRVRSRRTVLRRRLSLHWVSVMRPL